MDQWQVLSSQFLPVHNDLFVVAAPKIAELQQCYFSSSNFKYFNIFAKKSFSLNRLDKL